MERRTVDYRFKILYAVGMIMVVCGHASGGGISIISDWFPYQGMHLALFAFGSGYFYNKSAEDNIKKYIKRKIQTLIIPLYIYTLVYGMVVHILRQKGFEIGGDLNLYSLLISPITDGHVFVYNMGGWFVVPLFVVEIYNVLGRSLIKKINSKIPEWVFFVIDLSVGILGNQLACVGYWQGWSLVLVRTAYFIPFYSFGILYKEYLEKIDKKISTFYFFAVVFVLKYIIIAFYCKVPSYTPSWCNDFTEGPVMPIVVGYLGIAVWMRIAIILEPVIGRSKWINAIANNTYSIMMNQFLGFMVVKTVFAFISNVYCGFSDFDWIKYKTDIWYYYQPRGVSHSLIIYVVAGLMFPILIQKVINKIKKIVHISGQQIQ